MVNGAPIVWSSRKQACVATSTTESEYIAANSTAKDVIWIRRLFADLGFAQIIPTRLLLDNQSAIRLVHNPEFHRRTEHIDVVNYFIREHQACGTINVIYIPTVQQLADIFTKALPFDRFQLLRNLLGLVHMPAMDRVEASDSVCQVSLGLDGLRGSVER